MNSSLPIYMDYHSTTPVDPRVQEALIRALNEDFGNPHSQENLHGQRAAQLIKHARKNVASLVNCKATELIFTSGATESINLALRGFVLKAKRRPVGIVLTPTEHKAVIETCNDLSSQGFSKLHWLSVDKRGRIDLDQLEKICSSGIDLVCVMAANNEIGTIHPIRQIATIATKYGCAYLCDATQLIGHLPFDFPSSGVSLLAFSSHKLYGPKGCGALVVRNGYHLSPILTGGAQENGLRSGTMNSPTVFAFGEACRLRTAEMDSDSAKVAALRDRLQAKLQESLPSMVVNGDPENRLPGNLNFYLPGIPNSAMIARLRHKLSISTGAACSSGAEAPSHVLTAIGYDHESANQCLRIGLGKFTTSDDVDLAIQTITETASSIALKIDSVCTHDAAI